MSCITHESPEDKLTKHTDRLAQRPVCRGQHGARGPHGGACSLQGSRASLCGDGGAAGVWDHRGRFHRGICCYCYVHFFGVSLTLCKAGKHHDILLRHASRGRRKARSAERAHGLAEPQEAQGQQVVATLYRKSLVFIQNNDASFSSQQSSPPGLRPGRFGM